MEQEQSKALFNFNEVTPQHFKREDIRYIPTGLNSFDNLTNDLPTKKVTLVTGVPKEGKSTFVHRIALNAIDRGFRVLLIDGEHNREDIIQRLYSMVIGGQEHTYTAEDNNKFKIYVPKRKTLELLKNWHKDNLFVFNKYLAPIDNLEKLFEFINEIVEKNKIDLVIADNLMVLVDGVSSEKVENQSRFMKRICDLAKFKNCHCIVVAHPNKNAKQGEPMGIYDVLGSSDIVNLIDYLVQIMRSYDPSEQADAYARLILNRTKGRNIGDIPLKFDNKRDALFEMKLDGKALEYDFNWQNEGKQEQFVPTNDSPF
jgi:KaiC/GvpD/RAD55 family RecA-like ATPase